MGGGAANATPPPPAKTAPAKTEIAAILLIIIFSFCCCWIYQIEPPTRAGLHDVRENRYESSPVGDPGVVESQ